MKTKEELIEIHKELDQSLDKLLACWIGGGNERYPSKANLMDFLEWSFQQTQNPECFKPE